MSRTVDRLVSAVVMLALCAMATVLVWREVRGDRRSATSADDARASAPSYVPSWRDVARVGITLGSKAAPVSVVVFADLQCPACRRFHLAWTKIRDDYADRAALVFVHYPLPYHPSALPAARALECAAREGRASGFVDAVFRLQDSLGAKAWTSYATDAGIDNLKRFVACTSDTSTVSRIAAGLEAGKRLAIAGTATVMVNG